MVVISIDRCNMIWPEVGLEVAYERVIAPGESGAVAALEGR
jgi:hypothetical protein